MEHRIDLAADPSRCLDSLPSHAEHWGASWQQDGAAGGRLGLPVVAGLRHGWVEGPLEVESSALGSKLTFRVEKSRYRLNAASVLFLLLGAFGALLCLVGPFVPALRPAVPMGILLGVAAWLFIVAGLRNSGPEEFLAELAREVEAETVHGGRGDTTAGE